MSRFKVWQSRPYVLVYQFSKLLLTLRLYGLILRPIYIRCSHLLLSAHKRTRHGPPYPPSQWHNGCAVEVIVHCDCAFALASSTYHPILFVHTSLSCQSGHETASQRTSIRECMHRIRVSTPKATSMTIGSGELSVYVFPPLYRPSRSTTASRLK